MEGQTTNLPQVSPSDNDGASVKPVTSVPVPFHRDEADVFRQSLAQEFRLENQSLCAQYFSEPALGLLMGKPSTVHLARGRQLP